jgi:hypothetical protein
MSGILMSIIIDSMYISDAHAQTNTTDLGTKRIITTQKTTASGENATDVGYNQILPNRIINNVGDLAVDKFSTIFIADSGNKSYSKV